MSDNKRYYWLKLNENFFEEDTIAWLEEQENGKDYVIFYLKLCLKSLQDDGKLIRYVGARLMPYDVKALSKLTNTPIDTVAVAMKTFNEIGLIEKLETGEIFLTQIDEMIGSETEVAKRVRKHRAKQVVVENQGLLQSNIEVTKSNTEIELELDKELDKDKEIKEESKKKPLCKYSDEHLRLSLKLQSNLSSDFPKEMNKVNINKWADVIRLMEERDQLTITQIEYVIDWLPTNDFWFGNIRSTSKLREKFDKLVFEIKTEKQKSEQPKNKFRKPMRQEQLPEWAKKEYQPVEDEIDPEVERRLAEYAKRNGT